MSLKLSHSSDFAFLVNGTSIAIVSSSSFHHAFVSCDSTVRQKLLNLQNTDCPYFILLFPSFQCFDLKMWTFKSEYRVFAHVLNIYGKWIKRSRGLQIKHESQVKLAFTQVTGVYRAFAQILKIRVMHKDHLNVEEVTMIIEKRPQLIIIENIKAFTRMTQLNIMW